MDYKPKSLMREDYLKMVKLFVSDIFQTKLSKLILMFVLIIHIGITAIHIYFIVFKVNSYKFVDYAPIFFSTIYGMIASTVLLTHSKVMVNISDEISLWTIGSADEETRIRIRKHIKIITVVAVATVFCTVLTGILFLLPLPKEEEFFFAYRLFEDYFPNEKIILSIIYRVTYLPLIYSMVVHPLGLVYYLQHSKFQTMLISRHIEHITDYDNENEDDHQKEIADRMKFCIIRHSQLINFGKKKLEEMNYLIGIFSLSGCALCLSIIIFMFHGNFYKEYYTRLTVCSLTFCICFVTLFVQGQLWEEEVESLLCEITCALEWYTFNSSNKKIYLIFLINVMKDFKIQFLSYCVNYELALSIIRGVYAVASVMINVYDVVQF